VERFQARHGLVPDGVLGPDTFRALSVPPPARVTQIEHLFSKLVEHGMQIADRKMTIGGVLDGVRVRISQRKLRYALAKLCSEDGSVELVVGPSAFERHHGLMLDGNEVLVRGVINLDDAQGEDFTDLRDSLKMYADSITLYRGDGGNGVQARTEDATAVSPASTRATGAPAGTRLFLKFTELPSREVLARLHEAASEMKGDIPGYLVLPAGGGKPRKLYLGDDFLLDAGRAKDLERKFPLRVIPVAPPPQKHRL